ncbi:C13 family peptidase [soil metagenome]
MRQGVGFGHSHPVQVLPDLRSRAIAPLRILFTGLIALLAITATPAAAASPFSDWAAIVVSADNHASGGGHSDVFDNGRRDLVKALVGAGFSSGNILQFSVQPDREPNPKPFSATPFQSVYDRTMALTEKAPGGCLIYFTSHGSPDGIVLGDDLLQPQTLATLVDDACGKRPTVAVISACFSGVFVPALSWPNRLIMTAARSDRTSFGCGAEDRYTYFDDCFLQGLTRVSNLQALTTAVPACVAKKETDMRAGPPSEPQVSAGAQIRAMLPLYDFAKPSG